MCRDFCGPDTVPSYATASRTTWANIDDSGSAEKPVPCLKSKRGGRSKVWTDAAEAGRFERFSARQQLILCGLRRSVSLSVPARRQMSPEWIARLLPNGLSGSGLTGAEEKWETQLL